MEYLDGLHAGQNGGPPQASVDYDALLNAVKVGMIRCLLNEELTILWANDSFYGLLGVPAAGAQSLRDYFMASADEFAAFRDGLLEAFTQGKKDVEPTVCFPHTAGGCLWIRMSGSISYGQTTASTEESPIFSACCTDVSDLVCQKEEKDRLYREKARYFEWMMDEYVGNIYLSDMDTYELLFLNRTACETLGSSLDKVLGRKCYEVIQGRDTPCPFCTNHRLNTKEFYEWEFYNPILERTFMIKNRQINWNGHRTRIELSHDMYSAEFKLAKKDREREALLKTIPGGFARLDARDNSTVLWYSARFLNLIGYTEEQFKNEMHSQARYIHPDDLTRATILMEDIRENQKSVILEMRIITHSGDTKILTTTLCYVSAENSWDGIPSFYSVYIDVTKEREEQTRQRKALEDAYQTAQVANAAKTNFLSAMSHDIRTPMNAVIGMASIAQMNLDAPDKVHDCLSKIEISSHHLLNLINEVLDMSKIESGKVDLLPENIDLSELMQNVVDMCRPLITEKQQEFQLSVGLVRHEKVIVDGDRLRQVFMNLLSNAIKYTPVGGSISLRINELSSPLMQKGQYEFIFTDNGIGMSADYVPHIFEPFSRAEDSRISKTQGTGLGMAITENIVRMMNGTIQVKSELGQGTQFVVSIPLELQLTEESCDKELSGRPVLVVDDDQVVCENATALLDELGMRGYWVLSGMEAIASVADAHRKKDDFFAVILDWKMPGMDGLETVKLLKRRFGEDVPIIIISAYDYSSIEEEFLRAGADAFITKPLFKSKMLHVLELFCGSSRGDTVNTLTDEKRPVLCGKRVLLAEDNELNREIAVELLESQDIIVETAENGKRALEAFQASSPGEFAAVLMDIQMPVMDGYEATAAIRALDRADAREVPILALTANAFTADVSKARNLGMNDHIAKPIDVERLFDILQKWIEKQA